MYPRFFKGGIALCQSEGTHCHGVCRFCVLKKAKLYSRGDGGHGHLSRDSPRRLVMRFLSDAIFLGGKHSKNAVNVFARIGQSLMPNNKLRMIDLQSMLRLRRKRYPADHFFGQIRKI